ncbi:MAG: Com family DNA-binding transcriptional regulator [Magnetococcales bacterium]|nr:Com family DNA-binding transcriptional regulator [Magnetococcales bacterium]
MQDFRCSKCGKKLARLEGTGAVEIKCPRCGTVNSQRGVETRTSASGKVLGGSPSKAIADLEPADTLEEEVRRAMAMHMNLHV